MIEEIEEEVVSFIQYEDKLIWEKSNTGKVTVKEAFKHFRDKQ